MTTARDLLDLIAEYVAARSEGGDEADLQDVARRFDVALGEALVDRASVQSEA
ncbi:hypothetical protein ACI797_07560 [Geodermatophilus sp. SYSU D00691]